LIYNSFSIKVNHNKLIQILREQVNDSTTLNLIRKCLKAGVVEKQPKKATETGLAERSSLLPLLSNIHLEWTAMPRNTADIAGSNGRKYPLGLTT